MPVGVHMICMRCLTHALHVRGLLDQMALEVDLRLSLGGVRRMHKVMHACNFSLSAAGSRLAWGAAANTSRCIREFL